MFSWRILWLLNLPTGLLLRLARRLHSGVRQVPARARPPRRGAGGDGALRHAPDRRRPEREDDRLRARPCRPGSTSRRAMGARIPGPNGGSDRRSRWAGAWSISGCCCGCRPILVSRACRWRQSRRLLAQSALIAFPTVAVGAFLYSRWSTKGVAARRDGRLGPRPGRRAGDGRARHRPAAGPDRSPC